MIIPPEKRIRVMALETSCQKSCPHCFLDPGQGDFRQTERIALDAHTLGYEAHFYATAVSPRCDAIYKQIGQDSESASICVRGESVAGNVSWLTSKQGRVGFSLHGASAQTHELLAGENTFDITLAAIQHIRQHNPLASINIWCAMHRKNMHELHAICEQAHDLGADYLTLIKLSYLGRARQLDADWFLNQEEIATIIAETEALYATGEFPNPHISLAPNWGMTARQAEKFRQGRKSIYCPTDQYCPAGQQRFAVDGRTKQVYPCHFMADDDHFIIGEWTEQGIVVTNTAFANGRAALEEPCRSCDLLPECGGGCRFEAIVEHLRLTGRYNFHAGLENCRYALTQRINTK